MTAHLKCLKYLIRHKYYVARECFRHGLYWRGIKHDWSKLLPSEWFAYAEQFYGIGSWSDDFEKAIISYRRRELAKETPFEYTKAGVKLAFSNAWLKHQHRNPHHYQHWILRQDDGKTFCLEMPKKDALEMYCDWVGAGLALTGKRDIVGWYEKNKFKIKLHPKTRTYVESLIYGQNQV